MASEPTVVSLLSSQPTTSTGPVATPLLVALAANKKYFVRFDCQLQNSGGGAGIGFNGPAGATIKAWRECLPNNNTRIVKEITTFGTVTTGTDGGSVTSWHSTFGYITTGVTAGDLVCTFGSTTGGATTTMFAGATLEVYEIADTEVV